ncbi:unnamed protein product [Pleuronectes platessa]|uniref:Uncharacterized protein n=1 Tax=Pleuronectes platessa TaxID=8262 RepID=A0A9N7VUP1_PLEPL|nr:unnamed protein product [Pleuronectes platessa]
MKASTGVRQTAAESRELVISETGQRRTHRAVGSHAPRPGEQVLGESGALLRGTWTVGWGRHFDSVEQIQVLSRCCSSRYQKFCTWSCWPVSKQEVPAGVLPATKLDVTEVQWDLSWMEMSNLLEKDSYCGT